MMICIPKEPTILTRRRIPALGASRHNTNKSSDTSTFVHGSCNRRLDVRDFEQHMSSTSIGAEAFAVGIREPWLEIHLGDHVSIELLET